MKRSSKKIKVALWEWIVSIIIIAIAGIILWTNETVDFLTKMGITLTYGYTMILFGIIFVCGLTWFSSIIMRKKGYF